MMTIQTKFALWYSALLTLIIAIFSIAVIVVSRATTVQTVDSLLAEVAENVISNIQWDSETPTYSTINFDSDDAFHIPGISVEVWLTFNDNGKQSTEPIEAHRSHDRETHQEALYHDGLSMTKPHHHNIIVDNVLERVLTRPFYADDDDNMKLGVVQVATSLHAVAQSNNQLVAITLLAAIICISAAVGVGLWLSRYLLKPIRVITATAASIADADDLSTRLEWQGPNDEYGGLIYVFNRMMERLEYLFSVQQRFISDISHELRTPLTSIIGNLDLIEHYQVEEDSLDVIHRSARRMARMVNDLLLLSRADLGSNENNFHPIDLDEIGLMAYEEALRRAKHRQLSIVLDRFEPVHIMGDGERIQQLMMNLLHNAIKFTKDGGKITLSVYPQGDQAVIEVQDTGIGIALENLERIFDRFFQVDNSRVQHDESDGAGLGLSIVRWIVNTHGGKIDVKSHIGEGTLFRVQLPMETKPVPSHTSGSRLDDTDIPALKIKTRPAVKRPTQHYK